MAVRTSQRISNLENEIKALKATYSVYGGLMQTYITSGTWKIPDGTLDCIVRFRPNYHRGKKVLISSVFLKYIQENGYEYAIGDSYIASQDGSGDVYIHLGVVFGNDSVFVQLAAPVPGTLTLVS